MLIELDTSKSYNCESITKSQFKQLREYFRSIGEDWSRIKYKDFVTEPETTIYYINGTIGWIRTERFIGEVNIQEVFEKNKLTRFEYITENGRELVERGEFEFSIQDEGRTLKVWKK